MNETICIKTSGGKRYISALANSKPESEPGAIWLTVESTLEITPTEKRQEVLCTIPRDKLEIAQRHRASWASFTSLTNPFPEWIDQGRLITTLTIETAFRFQVIRHTRKEDGTEATEIIFPKER
jgi:hypothetical protein